MRRLLFRRLLSQYAGTVTVDLFKLNNFQFKNTDINTLFADSGIVVNNARLRFSVNILEVDQKVVTMNAGLDITPAKYDALLTGAEGVLTDIKIRTVATTNPPPPASNTFDAFLHLKI